MLYPAFMSFSLLIHGVWLVGLVLQVLLAVILIFKGLWRKFPIFASYTIFSLLETAVGYAVFHNLAVYI